MQKDVINVNGTIIIEDAQYGYDNGYGMELDYEALQEIYDTGEKLKNIGMKGFLLNTQAADGMYHLYSARKEETDRSKTDIYSDRTYLMAIFQESKKLEDSSRTKPIYNTGCTSIPNVKGTLTRIIDNRSEAEQYCTSNKNQKTTIELKGINKVTGEPIHLRMVETVYDIEEAMEDARNAYQAYQESKTAETKKSYEMYLTFLDEIRDEYIEQGRGEELPERESMIERIQQERKEPKKIEKEAEESGLKYELTDITKEVNGETLYQIRALKTFRPSNYCDFISKGDLGGFVAKEENLSQEGNCWVSKTGVVYGNAKVEGDAEIYGDAEVGGNARIQGMVRIADAKIKDNVIICDNVHIGVFAKGPSIEISGNVRISGNSKISGGASISGNAEIKNAHIEQARITDNVVVQNARIGDPYYSDHEPKYVRLKDHAVVSRAEIRGSAQIGGNARVEGKEGRVLITDKAEVTGNAYIHGTTYIRGMSLITDNAEINGKGYKYREWVDVGEMTVLNGNAYIEQTADILHMTDITQRRSFTFYPDRNGMIQATSRTMSLDIQNEPKEPLPLSEFIETVSWEYPEWVVSGKAFYHQMGELVKVQIESQLAQRTDNINLSLSEDDLNKIDTKKGQEL